MGFADKQQDSFGKPYSDQAELAVDHRFEFMLNGELVSLNISDS